MTAAELELNGLEFVPVDGRRTNRQSHCEQETQQLTIPEQECVAAQTLSSNIHYSNAGGSSSGSGSGSRNGSSSCSGIGRGDIGAIIRETSSSMKSHQRPDSQSSFLIDTILSETQVDSKYNRVFEFSR